MSRLILPVLRRPCRKSAIRKRLNMRRRSFSFRAATSAVTANQTFVCFVLVVTVLVAALTPPRLALASTNSGRPSQAAMCSALVPPGPCPCACAPVAFGRDVVCKVPVGRPPHALVPYFGLAPIRRWRTNLVFHLVQGQMLHKGFWRPFAKDLVDSPLRPIATVFMTRDSLGFRCMKHGECPSTSVGGARIRPAKVRWDFQPGCRRSGPYSANYPNFEYGCPSRAAAGGSGWPTVFEIRRSSPSTVRNSGS